MSNFWKQYRVLIAIFTVFLTLGIAPLAVMRFFPPEQSEQSETELPAAENTEVSTEETIAVEPAVAESTSQHPFNRFLETSPSDETEEAENKENIAENAENNVENAEKDTTDQFVSAQPARLLESILQPEKIFETPINPETLITTTLPVTPAANIDTKNNDNSTPAKPEPIKPAPVKSEPVNKEPAKPQPVKKEETSKSKPEPSKPEPSKPESPKPELIVPIQPEPPTPQPKKIETTKTASDWIPFIYFYQRSPSGHQKLTLFPLAPKSAPVVIETKPTATLVPVIPAIPVVPIIPVIQIQPVYSPIFVPIIYYPPYR
ncbi:MAG: hypothetical protein LBF88_04165 [Planctomycetaceae bacterium]|jgi:hypothetical protein|nr:hypothetical protein [Planctomycetaceae bacterium]